ncbi:MAG: hypothetical protein R2810_06415 [Flavobacteriales bacterium]
MPEPTDELERQLRADLLPLVGLPVLEPEGWAGTTPASTACGTVYDDQNYLCALDLGVEDVASVDPSSVPSTIALLNARMPRSWSARNRRPWNGPGSCRQHGPLA